MNLIEIFLYCCFWSYFQSVTCLLIVASLDRNFY